MAEAMVISSSAQKTNDRDLFGKKKDILAGARRAFAQRGFDGTTIDDVIKESGVARRTLYQYYSSKEDLFAATVGDLCTQLVEPLRLRSEGSNPQDVLTRFGEDLLGLTMAEQSLDIYRLVIAESKRFPELGRTFYRSGHETSAPILAAYLAAQTRAGILTVENPDHAAHQFFAMISTTLRMKRLCGVAAKVSAAERREWVRQTVDFFLLACGYKKPIRSRT